MIIKWFRNFKKRREQNRFRRTNRAATFEMWLKTQSNVVQDHILGPEKAELFRKGEVKISSPLVAPVIFTLIDLKQRGD
jgi:hypothetical protein